MFSTEFILTSLVVVLVPGTGVIYTVSTGLALRQRASIAAAIGCTLGIVPHLLASILGLSAILNMSAQAFQIIKYAGALYLLYLAWSMWRDTGTLKFDQSVQKTWRDSNCAQRHFDQYSQPQTDHFLFRIFTVVCHAEHSFSDATNDRA